MTDKIEGYLEVGHNEKNEIIINLPQDMTGHIVFSPNQARHLAQSLNSRAAEVERLIREQENYNRRKAAEAIPVDRSAQTMTDGSPVTPDHREINPATGMQKGYVILSAEERAKGFVRPVRRSYRHIGAQGPKYPLRDLTDEEKSQYVNSGYAKLEVYPENESPMTGRFWSQQELDNIGKGCGIVTTMGVALSETWARDNKFYSGTFCANCRRHYPVEEFVWWGTDETLGS